MRMLSFANRNRKEILRDPLSLIFGIGFPLILLLLMTWLKKSLPDMPTELFALSAFAPGMVTVSYTHLWKASLSGRRRQKRPKRTRR